MSDFARAVDKAVPGVLNPGEQVIWTGHCLSRLGKQKKASAAIGTPGGVLAVTLAAMLGLSICLVTRVPLAAFVVAVVTGVVVVSLAPRWLGNDVKDDAMYCRKQTAYVLTDQRAFVLKHCRTAVPVRSIGWQFVDHVRAERVGADGRGTVMFRNWDPVAQRWETALQFSRVSDAAWVAEWSQAAMERAKA